MKIECGRDVTERTTFGEASPKLRAYSLIWHCVEQGVVRGFLYGALAGVWFLIIGAIYGAVVGAGAGWVIGLLDGVVLAVMDRRHQRAMGDSENFIRRASRIMPIVTFAAVLTIRYVITAIIDLQGSGPISVSANLCILAIGVIPASIAAFAAWQSVQKLKGWYSEGWNGIDD